jgi:transcriptional regulator with XRE-family HTH domain
MEFHELTDPERWGLLIKDHRTNQLFLPQAEFAERIRELAAAGGVDLVIDQSTVSRWESGHCAPALRVRPFIAQACGTSPALLFQRTQAAA